MNRNLLLHAWKSRVALYTPPLSVGVDIIIPVVLGEASCDNVPLEASLDTISFIAVQVKNRKTPIPVATFLPGLINSEIYQAGLKPALGILANMGSSSVPLSLTASDGVPIVVLGRDHMVQALNLPEQICLILESISNFHEGPQEKISRTYDPTMENDEIANNAFLMLKHIHPDACAFIPQTHGSDLFKQSRSKNGDEMQSKSKRPRAS